MSLISRGANRVRKAFTSIRHGTIRPNGDSLTSETLFAPSPLLEQLEPRLLLSTTTLGATHDAFVSLSNPTQKTGNWDMLGVLADVTAAGRMYQSYLRFNSVGDIPEGSTVNSATLRMYC